MRTLDVEHAVGPGGPGDRRAYIIAYAAEGLATISRPCATAAELVAEAERLIRELVDIEDDASRHLPP
jgi:hypothetical protein